MPVYLDYNATAPVRPEVVSRMAELLAGPANPSSAHRYGREAKKNLETARRTIAETVSAWPDEIIFTASGTESNHMALRGFPGRRLLVGAVEHSSVLQVPSLQGAVGDKAIPPGGEAGLLRCARNDGIIPVTSQGVIDLAALAAMLADASPALVSVMLANNETGVIQPIAEIASFCKTHGALLHCDAAQGLGKVAIDFGALGADMLTLSAHKCGGPVGAAALVIRRDLPIAPLLTGGGQELRRRAGTENVAAIAGFAIAAELTAEGMSRMTDLRGWLDEMEKECQSLGGEVFCKAAPRLPNTSCLAMPGAGSELQLMDFDLKGFAVSAGSACSSGRIEPSHVLAAQGVPKELAACAIRVSGGWGTTASEVRSFTSAWKQLRERLRK